MLSSISWAVFTQSILTLAAVWYGAVALLFYRKEIQGWIRRRIKTVTIFVLVITRCRNALHAQTADGNNGINQANTMVRSYFDSGTQLLYAVAAIAGLIGAFRVYSLLQHDQRQDAGKAAAGWIAACIFIVLVATVIKSFFGLS
jgi:putative copper export protein